ncbi:MAG TPA: 4-(cytidine 5'-diphospho)-2-C-methyl-D-erythritol kinase [Longimicrobiales bacterium]
MTRAPDLVEEHAPAKINLHLRIVARTADGYHDLETLFQALELHDTLEARRADETTLDVAGGIETGPASENLVLRAARAFEAAVPGAPRVAFRLTKRIPSAAGLGGGSSDAAATLRAMNALAGSPLAGDALRELGATLGADVAFFLCGSPIAWATGRGEKLVPRATLPAAPVLVVDPGFSVSTRDAFGWWDALPEAARSRVASPPPATGPFAALRGAVHNDFETVVFARHPELAAIRDALARAGASLAMLSGSGSCVYGLFDADAAADAAAALIGRIAPRVRVLRTRTRA